MRAARREPGRLAHVGLLVAMLVAVPAIVAGVGLPAVAVVGGGAGQVRAADRSGFDPTLTQTKCALLGRLHVAGRGCDRNSCVAGAKVDRGARGAEVCRLTGPRGDLFATAVDFRMCRDLHRVWVAEVNWCASNPRRNDAVVERAAACRAPFTTLVTQREVDGWYDECLRPSRVKALRSLARSRGTTVTAEAGRRSPVLCADRPGFQFTADQCVATATPVPAADVDVLIGDSIAWRSNDELARLAPGLLRDSAPGRRFRDAPGRLARQVALHGTLRGLVLELGTNRSGGSTYEDFNAFVASVPADTRLMLVLPYRTRGDDRSKVAPFTTKYTEWMTQIARTRPGTCVADWRSVARNRPQLLVDDAHVRHSGEGFWARWLVRQWTSCSAGAAHS